MKKYFLIMVCFIMMFAVTACSSNRQLKCSGKLNDAGVGFTEEITANLNKNDTVTDIVVTYDFDNSEVVKKFCDYFKKMEQSINVVKVTCSDTKITIENYEKTDANIETMIGKSKEEFKTYISSSSGEKITCE